MSLCFVREEFVECDECRAKPGSPALCRECLERRELLMVVAELRKMFIVPLSVQEKIRLCMSCRGTPNPECAEHGR